MNADGSAQSRLTTNSASDFRPVWSPDLYQDRLHLRPRRQLRELHDERQRELPDQRLQQLRRRWFRWSPDGQKLAFQSNRTGQIFVQNADGTGTATNLTNNALTQESPEWSPDGTKIAYDRQDANREVYVMNANGSSPTNISNSSGDDSTPDWLPDGQKIAFEASRDGNKEIYTMNADATGPQTNITNNAADDRRPDWQIGPATTAYDTPNSASSIDTSLVPAYRPLPPPTPPTPLPLACPPAAPPRSAPASWHAQAPSRPLTPSWRWCQETERRRSGRHRDPGRCLRRAFRNPDRTRLQPQRLRPRPDADRALAPHRHQQLHPLGVLRAIRQRGHDSRLRLQLHPARRAAPPTRASARPAGSRPAPTCCFPARSPSARACRSSSSGCA